MGMVMKAQDRRVLQVMVMAKREGVKKRKYQDLELKYPWEREEVMKMVVLKMVVLKMLDMTGESVAL